jgi:hypothetical protein
VREQPIQNPAPTDLAVVLSPEWLSQALSTADTRVKVRAVTVIETIGPSATKVRLRADYAEPAPTNLPEALCLKGFFGGDVHGYLRSGVQRAETLFYRECAPSLSLRVPRCVYAGVDEATQAGVIVMEDLVARGARFLTALQSYAREDAERSLDQLARLHACSERLTVQRWPWTGSRLEALTSYELVPPPRLTELLKSERGHGLPESIRDGERLYAALRVLAKRARELSEVLIHGDAHAGNVFVLPGSENCQSGFVDWQLLQRGHWSLDVAYHIAAVLGPEQRVQLEDDLLRFYLDRLKWHGGSPPSLDDAWHCYRESLAYGYFLWGITVRVEPAVIREFIQRLGSAVAHHDSFGRMGV